MLCRSSVLTNLSRWISIGALAVQPISLIIHALNAGPEESPLLPLFDTVFVVWSPKKNHFHYIVWLFRFIFEKQKFYSGYKIPNFSFIIWPFIDTFQFLKKKTVFDFYSLFYFLVRCGVKWCAMTSVVFQIYIYLYTYLNCVPLFWIANVISDFSVNISYDMTFSLPKRINSSKVLLLTKIKIETKTRKKNHWTETNKVDREYKKNKYQRHKK